MTLERPAYTVTVTNLDNPWTQTVTAGEVIGAEAGVWLDDALSIGWRFSGPPPAQLEPEIASFSILVDGIANLPAFEQGDRVTVSLQRPTDTDPITFMDFAGRISDRKLRTTARTGRLLLALTATDPTSDGANLPFANPLGGGRLEQVYRDVYTQQTDFGVYYYDPAPHDPLAPVDPRFGNTAIIFGTASFSEFIPKMLAAGLDDTYGFPVQRYVSDAITAADWYEKLPFSGETPVWDYYLAQWLPQLAGALPALFVYAFSTADADRVTANPIADPLDVAPTGALIVVDAAYLPDGADWDSDRTDAPNQISLTGLNPVNGEVSNPVTKRSASAQARYGVIVRTIDTWASSADLSALATRYLALCPSASAEAWQFLSASIDTAKMDDATLDAYASQFWTPREPTPGVMGKPAVLANVDPDVDPTGGYLIAHLAGARFIAEDGHLVIVPELLPAALPAVTAGTTQGPTYDQFKASAFTNATYHDQGGSTDYVDHGLTFEKSKFTTL